MHIGISFELLKYKKVIPIKKEVFFKLNFQLLAFLCHKLNFVEYYSQLLNDVYR